MEATPVVARPDSGDRSTDDEKAVGGPFVAIEALDLPPDPDAHLSPEQKAVVVCQAWEMIVSH